MITSTKAAQLARDIYDPIKPNTFDKIYGVHHITCGVSFANDVTAFTFAGTENMHDKIIDAESAFTIEYHPRLGRIVGSFYKGMDDIFSMLKPDIHAAQAISINGHSLGASHAALFGMMLLNAGYSVSSIDLIAPPLTSDTFIVNYLMSACRVRAWHNPIDPVPEFPKFVDLFQYPLSIINQPPEHKDDPIAWHHAALYADGIADWEATQ